MVSQSLRYLRPHPVSNHLTTDKLGLGIKIQRMSDAFLQMKA